MQAEKKSVWYAYVFPGRKEVPYFSFAFPPGWVYIRLIRLLRRQEECGRAHCRPEAS